MPKDNEQLIDIHLSDFLNYLKVERTLSDNTVSAYRCDLKLFFLFLIERGLRRVAEVNPQHVRDFCKARAEQNISAKSMHRGLCAIRRFFLFLRKEGVLSVNPAADIDLPRIEKKLPKCAKPDEIDLLILSPKKTNARAIRDAAILATLYATGLRVSELCALNIFDIDLMRGFLKTVGKGKKERLIPLNERAIGLLVQYLDSARPALLNGHKSDLVFIRKDGLAISRQSIWKIIKKYARLSGMPADFSPHKVRHSFATHLLEGGINLRALQLILGHSDLSTTEIYMHVDKSRLVALYEKYHPRAQI